MKAVLFDLDGTLIDTAADFIRIIQDMCRAENCEVVAADLIRTQVSEGARAMVKLVYPHLEVDDPVFLAHRQRFLDLYGADIAVETDLFEGMYPLLDELEARGIPWGIVTNKPRGLSEALLAALNLTERCAVLVCPEDVTRTKPDPEPMYLAARQINLPAEQIIYVGDHPRDIEAGRNAGMYTILAAYGYLPLSHKDDLTAWQADCIVNDISELRQKVCQLLKLESEKPVVL
ncbi:HAD-IA family hydrolase [Acinetobacter radioresistens]|jgi:2-phosphoglycolate phosphatase|uniref:Phosphoglycolate phosphatase n=2 Tax=Acinetobacter radioresistens TaxID=40216 RepID=A0A3D3FZ34_ACIRA|nr:MULTISPECIES: HAD-IA family hydrolase [Acinetobacter]AWV85075.1 HAD family hydrolase [Acinetobacter radioresistens]EET81525.1 putative phosphoglycolate phosphatase, bacterial [Acinetobacter radioresistens SK82]EEY85562.1 putative phosphoglycolate phosphatase, bacterial [Acinetobacter radioresistens SH164]ENV86270.1 phosphoglycolate phosphatase, bacterial [Acinetobacter radioresistens NIPH 2130]EXE57061.1 HAD hydrolase, IA, variant 1 family protein [Acinetobacter sp. 1239920]